MKRINVIAFSGPMVLLTAMHMPTVNAAEASDTFEASVTIVADEPTCTFDVGSVDFGTVVAGSTYFDPNNNSTLTEFAIDIDCSQAVESASITFVKGPLDTPFGWNFLNTAGFPTGGFRIADANNIILAPDVPSEVPVTGGSQSLTYKANMQGLIGDYTGVFAVTVDVVFAF